ncbi:MAG TPA: NUDIX domain-containing protein, partial [Pedobacter sp.]|nr:NUDIX domain-containing protein [Pedobacter sp.]
VWSVPKGEGNENEEPLAAAIREFEEETGFRPAGEFKALAPVLQKGGKYVFCWAIKGEFDVSTLKSNTFLMEWPPKSGRMADIAEVDRAEWFGLDEAKMKINERQVPLLEEVAMMMY